MILPDDALVMIQAPELRIVYVIMPVMRPYAIEYVNGMIASVRNAGIESPIYRQLMSVTALAIIAPTRIRVQPVAQEGMEAKIGAKKSEKKKQIPVTQAVRPVIPPSDIPAPDSIKAVTGGDPNNEPMVIPSASTR